MILGIDLGNYSIKTNTGLNIDSKTKEGSGILTTSPIIDFKGNQFVLGEGEYCTEYRKVKKENYLDLLFATIALCSEDKRNKVVLGLPVSQYNSDKMELINLVLQNREMFGYVAEKNREILIEDVEVYPEGIAAVGNNFEGVIVDVGGRTTDICLVTIQNGKRKIENAFSEPIGTINLYSDFIKLTNNYHGLDLTLNDSKRLLKHGLKIKGKQVDISSSKVVFKNYVSRIESKLRIEYPIDTLDVALLGGGAMILGRSFKKKLPQSFIIDNPVFANANTFYKVGGKLWNK